MPLRRCARKKRKRFRRFPDKYRFPEKSGDGFREKHRGEGSIVCATSGFQLIMLIRRRVVSRPVLSPRAAAMSSARWRWETLDGRTREEERGRREGERGAGRKIHVNISVTRIRKRVGVSHVHSMTVCQPKKGFLERFK